jgi:hypothetical protein
MAMAMKKFTWRQFRTQTWITVAATVAFAGGNVGGGVHVRDAPGDDDQTDHRVASNAGRGSVTCDM